MKLALFISIAWHILCVSCVEFSFSTVYSNTETSFKFLGSILNDQDMLVTLLEIQPEKVATSHTVLIYDYTPAFDYSGVGPLKPWNTTEGKSKKFSVAFSPFLVKEEALRPDAKAFPEADWEKEELKLEIEEP